MSIWRASARVESPDGHAWEIYAYRLQLRDREEWDTGFDEPASIRAQSAFVLIDGIVWLFLLIPRAIVRLGDFVVAGARTLRSDEWTIEAIAFTPRRESYAWTTTTEYKGQVLAQVEGHLARGDIPQRLTNATYLGLRR